MGGLMMELRVPAGAMDASSFGERAAELAVEAPFQRPRVLEGIGAARYEAATGRRLERPTPVDPSYDFRDVELDARIDLKGPLPPRGGPVPDDRVAGLIEAVVWESNVSSGCDMVLVDTLGLTEAQRGRVRAAVAQRVRSSKTIAFLEDG